MSRIFLTSALLAGALFAQTSATPAATEMCGMMKARETAAVLADRLAASLAAIEAEKDPAALQAKLAEHAAILKELREALKPDGKMADKMKAMHEHMGHHQGAASPAEGLKDEVLEHQKEHSHE